MDFQIDVGGLSTDTTFHDLLRDRLEEARRKRDGSTDAASNSGLTIDLSHKKINNIPLEAIELMKGDIERLAISHNQLTGFPDEFAACSRLRYLNVRSNLFREFPQVICALESLEILDISRNRIRSLPEDFGYLTKLKVLSISKNKIQALPCSIGQMEDLKILKLDHNPISFPPREILGYEDDTDVEKDLWLEELKHYLRRHAEKPKATRQTEDSGDSSTDGGADTDHSMALKRKALDESSYEDFSDGQPSDNHVQSRGLMALPLIPDKNTQRLAGGMTSGWSGPSPINHMVVSAISQSMERSRSNSESTVINRAARRMGIIGQKQDAKKIEDAKAVKHHVRGISYDSSLNDVHQRSNPVAVDSSNVPFTTDNHRDIRRLSSVIRAKINPANHVQAITLARSLLYAMTQIQPILLAFVSIALDKNKPQSGLDRLLPAVSMNVNALVHALETHGTKSGPAVLESLTSACSSCAVTFRHVVTQLHTSLRDMRDDGDLKYAKTLLLMAYGSLMEISNSWTQFRAVLPNSVGAGFTSDVSSMAARSITPASGFPPYSTSGLHPGRGADAFMAPPTPSFGAMEGQHENPDEALFEKLEYTMTAAIQVITLFLEAIRNSIQQASQTTLAKLTQLTGVCNSGIEVSKRLKGRLDTIREADALERRRFAEDITRFVASIMSIGERARAGSSEFQFQKHVLTSFSPIARSTKEVTLLLHVSSFRGLNDANAMSNMHSQVASPMYQHSNPGLLSTPLSAALGAATQATLPISANGHNPSINSMMSSGRSDSMTSANRTNTGISEMNLSGTSENVLFSPRRV